MKILAFVDLHENYKAFKNIKEKAKKADIIVCAGDISIFEDRLKEFLLKLDKLDRPVLMIPGNHESNKSVNKHIKKLANITNIDKSVFMKDEHIFLGYGGGCFSMKDPSFDNVAAKFKKKIKDKKVILVTHAPPYDTKLDKIMKESCGNKNIKKFILKVKPNLVICGHLHENAGKEDKIKNIRMINPGPNGKILKI